MSRKWWHYCCVNGKCLVVVLIRQSINDGKCWKTCVSHKGQQECVRGFTTKAFVLCYIVKWYRGSVLSPSGVWLAHRPTANVNFIWYFATLTQMVVQLLVGLLLVGPGKEQIILGLNAPVSSCKPLHFFCSLLWILLTCWYIAPFCRYSKRV